jgi:hypothetical protein
MTEPLVDAREMLRGLRRSQVEFVVFGALAMVFYGYVRTTEDLEPGGRPRPREPRPGGGMADLDRRRAETESSTALRIAVGPGELSERLDWSPPAS